MLAKRNKEKSIEDYRVVVSDSVENVMLSR